MKSQLKAVNDPTNGAETVYSASEPYSVAFDLYGVADLLFHRWNCEAIEAKGKSAKGSKAKKTDDLESYVYRNDDGYLCIPSEYVRQSMIAAAKFKQDPRSPRKSMMDLAKAALVGLEPLGSLGIKAWDYEHRARVQGQRNGVTRVRPAIRTGWKANFIFQVNLPEYVSPDSFRELLDSAGRLCGVGDFRPTYGRFRVESFELLTR